MEYGHGAEHLDMAHVRQMQQRRVDSLECDFDVIFNGILAKNGIARSLGEIENEWEINRKRRNPLPEHGPTISHTNIDWFAKQLRHIEQALGCAADEFGGRDNQPSAEDERKHGWKY